jgi:hypothetical protein
MILFLKVAWTILAETYLHPLSTSEIHVQGGRVWRTKKAGSGVSRRVAKRLN